MGKINPRSQTYTSKCFHHLLCLLSTLLALIENPLQRFPRALLSFSVCPSPTSHKLKIFFLSIYTRQYPKKHSIITSQTCQISSDKEQLVFIDLALPPHWEKPGQSEVVIFLTLQISCFPAGAIAILCYPYISSELQNCSRNIKKTQKTQHQTKTTTKCI